MKANPLPAGLVGGGLLLTLGLLTFVLARGKPVPAHAGYPMAPPATQVSQNNPTQRQPSYGWLEMLDGNATPIPLRGTNLRIGRHQDNDICLENNSVSRRHAGIRTTSPTCEFRHHQSRHRQRRHRQQGQEGLALNCTTATSSNSAKFACAFT